MKVKCINKGDNKHLTEGKVNEALEKVDIFFDQPGLKIINDIGMRMIYQSEGFELIKEAGNMKELTFKEVITNIKEGEVWESGYKTIRHDSEGILIEEKEQYNGTMWFYDLTKYRLVRQEYSFQEALKTLEEGGEIESAYSKYSYKKVDDHYMIMIEGSSLVEGCSLNFSLNEIKGKWYINK